MSERNTLFIQKDWVTHSGGTAHYKIECDALTDEDIETLAFIVSQKGAFTHVRGVPHGGTRLAKALEKYRVRRGDGVKLIVDDVLTTGRSMEDAKRETGWSDAVGVVIFARGQCAEWIRPMFQMNWINVADEF